MLFQIFNNALTLSARISLVLNDPAQDFAPAKSFGQMWLNAKVWKKSLHGQPRETSRQIGRFWGFGAAPAPGCQGPRSYMLLIYGDRQLFLTRKQNLMKNFAGNWPWNSPSIAVNNKIFFKILCIPLFTGTIFYAIRATFLLSPVWLFYARTTYNNNKPGYLAQRQFWATTT